MHSEKFEKVKSYYDEGFWTADMVMNAVGKWIAEKEAKEIIGEGDIDAD